MEAVYRLGQAISRWRTSPNSVWMVTAMSAVPFCSPRFVGLRVLLEEIRDQQKLLLEGVVNMQKRALRRQLTLAIVLGVFFMAWVAWAFLMISPSK